MLASLNALVGRAVIWQDQKLGLVERAVPDVPGRGLDGLVIRRGLSVARWIANEDILLLGENCIVVRRKPQRMPEKKNAIPGRVFLTSGECAGEVTDVFVETDTLRLAALEVCQGPFYRLMGRRAYAAQFHMNAGGEEGDVTAPALLSWTQLKTQLEEGENR